MIQTSFKLVDCTIQYNAVDRDSYVLRLSIDGEQKGCYMYLGFITGNLLTAVIMSLLSDVSKCNILRHQEMHTGTPEYRAYRHQGAVKNCLVLRQVLPKLSAMAGLLRDKFLSVLSVSIHCISYRLPHCLSLSLISFK